MEELLRRHALKLIGGFALIIALIFFTYQLVTALSLATFACLIVGLGNPESFRFLFQASTTRAMVRRR